MALIPYQLWQFRLARRSFSEGELALSSSEGELARGSTKAGFARRSLSEGGLASSLFRI